MLERLNKETKNVEKLIEEDDESLVIEISKTFRTLYDMFEIIQDLFNTLEKHKIFAANAPFINYIKYYFHELYKGADIIFLPYEGYNYSILSITQYLKSNDFIKTYEREIILSKIPNIEKNNIFNHVICAHEIGHRIFIENKLLRKYLDEISISKIDSLVDNCLEWYKKKNRQTITLFEKPEFLATWKSWIEELFCDALGIALFGPAYFFAMVNFLPFLKDLISSNETHPPLWLRFYSITKFMGDGDNHLRYGQHFKNEFTKNTFGFWKDKSKDFYNNATKEIHLNKIEDYLFYLFKDDFLEPLFKITKGNAGNRTFDLSKANKIKIFSSYLENNVPPLDCESEIDDEISPLIYILNAGWDVYKTSFDIFIKNTIDRGTENYLEQAKLNLINLMSKSLSLSLIKKIWSDADKI